MEMELFSIDDLQKLCRLCMQTGSELYSIYDLIPLNEMGSHVQVLEMIMECTSLNINTDDSLPESICMECINFLCTAFNFKQSCERSDKKLKEIVVFFKESKKENEFIVIESEESKINSSSNNKNNIKNEINNLEFEKSIRKENVENIKIKNFYEDNHFEKKIVTENSEKRKNVQIIPRELKCSFCFKHFNTESNLKLHLRVCQGKTLNCGICLKYFSSTTELKAHLKNIHSIEINDEDISHIHTCDICDGMFFDRDKFFYHYQNHIDLATYYSLESDDHSLICYYCNVHFENVFDLENHIIIHKDDQTIFSCKLCDYKNTDHHSIKTHLKYHGLNPLICNLCLLTFESDRKFRSHVQTHKPVNKTNYSCQICENKFSTRDEIRRHITVHAKDIKTCKKCLKSFKNLADYEIHVKNHVHNPALCTVCGKLFTNRYFLESHMLLHNGIKPFPCMLCDKSFRTKSILTNHLLTHSDIKPFVCTVCEYSSRRLADLQIHLRVHTGDRPYSCTFPDCNMKFKTSSLQHQHMRTHTGNEEVFTCEVCNKTIAKRSFKQHKFIHTNERPHKCDICNKCFRRRNHLNIHKARVHHE